MFERQVIVTDEDGTITATYPDGTVKAVDWVDLIQIEVQTNDSGPWGTDVWWVLKGVNGECVYPQGATGDPEMIPKYEQLSGFDDRELTRAMDCTSSKTFICWYKDKPS